MGVGELKVSGQLALVTGAGSGIGRSIAIALARAGAKVIASDIDSASLERLARDAASSGWAIVTEPLDVTDRGRWVELSRAYPDVSILINNAGVGFWGSVFDTPRRAWERIFAINLIGVVNGCEAFGPLMARGARPTAIVNVASAASLNPVPNLGAYSASKFAVEGFSDVLAMELAQTGVRVITLHPGIINTPIVTDPSASAQNITPEQMGKVQHYYTTKGCSPEVVADAVVDGIRTGKARIITGPQARLSQIMRHFVPVGIKRKLSRRAAREIGYLGP